VRKLDLSLSADGTLPLVVDHSRPTRKRVDVREASPEESQAARDDTENVARASWDARLKKARDSLPKRFAWVPALSRVDGAFVLPNDLATRSPWITPAVATQLWEIVRSKANVIICGPFGTGKTTLLVMIARWYLRAAEYDDAKVREQRQRCEAHMTAERLPNGYHPGAPRDPDAMPQVWRARGLRFVPTYKLLTSNQRDVDDDAVEDAQRAQILLLDEIGEELGSAERGKYLSSSRSPAVTTVIKHRWDAEKRFFATTPYKPEVLDAMYEGGTFRRLVEDASGACVIDLHDDKWAGAFIRERAKKKSSDVKR
jgi:DNA replication protein DnaC